MKKRKVEKTLLELPTELILKILEYLDAYSSLNVSKASPKLYDIYIQNYEITHQFMELQYRSLLNVHEEIYGFKPYSVDALEKTLLQFQSEEIGLKTKTYEKKYPKIKITKKYTPHGFYLELYIENISFHAELKENVYREENEKKLSDYTIRMVNNDIFIHNEYIGCTHGIQSHNIITVKKWYPIVLKFITEHKLDCSVKYFYKYLFRIINIAGGSLYDKQFFEIINKIKKDK